MANNMVNINNNIASKGKMPANDGEKDDFYVVCERCGKRTSVDENEEHSDWHFAMDLQESDRSREIGSDKGGVVASKTGKGKMNSGKVMEEKAEKKSFFALKR